KTLAKLKLLGADSDHESINGKEVMRRLLQGYMVGLRHSSIRPDLPQILEELKEENIPNYSQLMLTTDGSTPSFYENGVMDHLIKICIEHGIPAIEAYLMTTLNPAKYFNLEHLHGQIATGRVADINFIASEDNPTPVSVLAKGKWVKRDGKELDNRYQINMDQYGFQPLTIDWNLNNEDLQYSMPVGISLDSSVITKPYSITTDLYRDKLDDDVDECFFTYIQRNGELRINTVLKGFAKNLDGLATTFTNTGDILLIGKNKKDMCTAFERMKEIGGGIVISKNGNIIYELPLTFSGHSSELDFESLIEKDKEFKKIMTKFGYRFNDPIYTLLFLTSTHLPYIRLTPLGLFDVMQKKVL